MCDQGPATNQSVGMGLRPVRLERERVSLWCDSVCSSTTSSLLLQPTVPYSTLTGPYLRCLLLSPLQLLLYSFNLPYACFTTATVFSFVISVCRRERTVCMTKNVVWIMLLSGLWLLYNLWNERGMVYVVWKEVQLKQPVKFIIKERFKLCCWMREPGVNMCDCVCVNKSHS